ncbi:hypothetical protein BASA50_003919 [Batrachochytrium salamandrivorans]|uniref:Uncharacterized protein n=1 Tax=Batrachochytrium salamandrivorans TaxID=1357716 RepID=A0ABQ8FH39_9FUNG|nr:hypothetical protein BASA50_003919 [Batrachochytrium salamandrivorans]
MSCFGLGCGSGSRVTQGRQVNGQESGMTQSSPERGQGPGSSGSSRKSLGHRLRSVFLSKSSRHGSGKNLVFKDVKKDPICGPILLELFTSQDKFRDFNTAFWKQKPEFHKLMKCKGTNGSNGEDGIKVGTTHEDRVVKMSEKEKRKDEEKKGQAEALRVQAIQEWLKSNLEAISDLQKIKAESISLKEDYLGIWERFEGSKCPIEEFEYLSPAEMTEDGYFLQWYDERGVDIFGEQ